MRVVDEEFILTLGMMADASLEMDNFVHALDKSDFDEATLSSKLDALYTILRRLFIDGQCFEVPGLTWVATQVLSRPRTYIVSKSVQSLGSTSGPSAAAKAGALKRMRAWTTVALAVMAAEFPEFELLASMAVFHLPSSAKSKWKAEPHEQQKSHLTKLANTLNQDPVALMDQFHLFEPIARQKKANSHSSNFEAWANAVVPMQASAKQKWCAPALIAALVRYGCWIASSSDVERGFAKTSKLRAGQSEDMFTTTEEAVLILQSDLLNAPQVHQLIKKACWFWAEFYRRPRQAQQKRIDTGVKRKPTTTGEAAFLRDRGEITRALAGQAGDLLPRSLDAPDNELDDLTDSNIMELEHNFAKQAKRLVESFLAGHLLEKEVTPAVLQEAEAHVLRLAKNQREVKNDKALKRKRLEKAEHDIVGARAFTLCDNVVITCGVTNVTERHLADVFITDDPSNVAKRILLLAGLTGASIAVPAYLKSGGKKGAVISYVRAVDIKRFLHISTEFMRLHPEICSDIYHVLQDKSGSSP